MENNIGKKAYCFEKLTGGTNLNGEPDTDSVSLLLRLCDIVGYNSETKQYVARTQFIDKYIDNNRAFFNEDELKKFFESFFLNNDILDFNDGETCYLCREIYTTKHPVNSLVIQLTKKDTKKVDAMSDYSHYYGFFYDNQQLHKEISLLLDTGILEDLPFAK